jgi:hypothetical protein
MKRINVFLTLAALFALLGLFTVCEQPAYVKNVTVTFVDPENKVQQGPVTVEQGQPLGGSFPADPANFTNSEGVTLYFYGWFDGFTEYDSSTPIGADITITARWSRDKPAYITVSFAFTDKGGTSSAIVPTAAVPPVQVIKGKKLSVSQLPTEPPRSKGWKFNNWYSSDADASPFDLSTPLNNDKTLYARWDEAQTFTVTFKSGTGGAPVSPITVFQNECIDEWGDNFPPKFTGNSVNPKAFFVAWLDDENREYNGRTVITRNVELTARWGLPPHVVNFRTEVDSVESDVSNSYGDVDYAPKVIEAWDSTAENPKWVVVNTTTYDSPYNTNRWRILYRLKMKFDSEFNIGFYTRYTIRARFYANKQGGPNPPDSAAFNPNNPAKGVGYNANGLLKGVNSPSDDSWGQISWTLVANWDGAGASAETMLQRYNLDRKGGTINDTWAPINGKLLPFPPYLLIQTSDNYIGHIEVTEIVFHNGEKKYTMYEDEEGYDEADDGKNDS